MTIVFSKLFLLVLISLSCTAITHTAPLGPNPNFVEILCSHTPHPKKCNHYLSKRNAEFQNNAHLLAIASLEVSTDEANHADTNLRILTGRKGLKAQEYNSLKLCVLKLMDCYVNLRYSTLELRNLSVSSRDFPLRKNKINEKINCAVTNIGICKKEFAPVAMKGKIKDNVMYNVTNVEDLIRNSMSLMYIYTAYRNQKFG